MIFGAHVRLHSFAVLGAPLVDVLARPVGTNKRDRLDVLVVADEIDTFVRTMYHVDHALRQVDLVE